MNKVYKFYGIGPNMTKFLNTEQQRSWERTDPHRDPSTYAQVSRKVAPPPQMNLIFASKSFY
jgi:hypothetical protein